MTKLEDFTSKELLFLSLVLDEKRKEFQDKIEIVEKFDASETKYELYEHFVNQLDTCTQWLTKVDESLVEVNYRETVY